MRVDTCQNCTFFFLKRFPEFVSKEGLEPLREKKCGSCKDGIWLNFRNGVDRFSIGRARFTSKANVE